jgi:hypothetical protein
VAPGPVWTPLIPSTMLPDKVKEFGKSSLFKRRRSPLSWRRCTSGWRRRRRATSQAKCTARPAGACRTKAPCMAAPVRAPSVSEGLAPLPRLRYGL